MMWYFFKPKLPQNGSCGFPVDDAFVTTNKLYLTPLICLFVLITFLEKIKY